MALMDQAVKEVKSLLRNNPDWSFQYCVKNVAGRYKVPLGDLMAEFGKARKGTRRIRKPLVAIKPWWMDY